MHSLQSLLDTHDGHGLATVLRQREITAGELLEAVIERLDTVEPSLNAVSERLYDQARAAARAPLDVNAPFAGVPTLVKDLFTPLAGARMTNGSLALGEARPDFDCELVSRLRQAGCLFVGTTTSPEFGTSYSTESRRFGATANPWNPAHSAGGSSGGAAALVAARVVPFAHGNDGGGSLRVPASCCGVFGLKPSRGRMPSGPMVGEGWAGMGTPHAMSLSVRDNALLLDATAGADLGAPYAAPGQDVPFASLLERDPRPLRIALVEHLAPWPTGPDALAAVGEAELDARTRVILRERGDIPAHRYAAAVEGLHALGRTLARFLTDYDVILTPTLTREPPRLGELDGDHQERPLAEAIAAFHSYSPFTALFNASGQPAMSVPLWWTPNGLPLGSHFAARFGEEGTLLALAAQLERAQPWAERRPPLAGSR